MKGVLSLQPLPLEGHKRVFVSIIYTSSVVHIAISFKEPFHVK